MRPPGMGWGGIGHPFPARARGAARGQRPVVGAVVGAYPAPATAGLELRDLVAQPMAALLIVRRVEFAPRIPLT